MFTTLPTAALASAGAAQVDELGAGDNGAQVGELGAQPPLEVGGADNDGPQDTGPQAKDTVFWPLAKREILDAKHTWKKPSGGARGNWFPRESKYFLPKTLGPPRPKQNDFLISAVRTLQAPFGCLIALFSSSGQVLVDADNTSANDAGSGPQDGKPGCGPPAPQVGAPGIGGDGASQVEGNGPQVGAPGVVANAPQVEGTVFLATR